MKTKTTLMLLSFLTLFSVNAFAQDFPYISLSGFSTVPRGVTFSADGKTVASTTEYYTGIWDVGTGNTFTYFDSNNGFGYDVALSPDGKMIATFFQVGYVYLYEVSTGETLWRNRTSYARNVYASAFSPDGLTIISGGERNVIDFWDAKTGVHLRSLSGHTDAILDLAISVDGQLLASASRDSTIRLWNAKTGRYLHTLTGHTEGVTGVAFSPDSQTLASGSFDDTTRLWSVSTGRHLRTLIGHTDSVLGVAISADGQTVASGSTDTTIRLWELSTGRHLHTLTGHAQPVQDVAFSPTERILASTHKNGAVLLWELPATHIRIIPADFLSPDIGKQFTVNLNIVAGENVKAYQASLTFDSAAIRYVSSANGSYLPDGAYYVPPVVSENKVTLGATSISDVSNGDGTLATVTFEVVNNQDSFIDLSDVILTGSQDEELHSLTHSTRIELSVFGDLNRDKTVNIQDLVLVAVSFGQTVSEEGNPADINGDGVVNIIDLVTVAGALGNSAAAPSALAQAQKAALKRTDVQKWLNEAQQLQLTDPMSLKGILFLEQLLAALTPKETALLHNYPNPFNPETWIPYQLASPADVSITIYAANGTLVRKLDLGHQAVGLYQHRSRAAYWDGKNAVGETVASGVYFYTLTAEDFSATRKMLILK